MTAFDSIFEPARDALLNLHGESITFKPASGTNSTFNAVVQRMAAGQIVELAGGRVLAPKMIVQFPRSSDTTVGRPTIDQGADKISVAYRKGGSAADHVIGAILNQDGGMWTVAIGEGRAR